MEEDNAYLLEHEYYRRRLLHAGIVVDVRFANRHNARNPLSWAIQQIHYRFHWRVSPASTANNADTNNFNRKLLNRLSPQLRTGEPPVGIEPTTCRLQGGRSGHLS